MVRGLRLSCCRDLRVRQTRRQEPQHLGLPRGQAGGQARVGGRRGGQARVERVRLGQGERGSQRGTDGADAVEVRPRRREIAARAAAVPPARAGSGPVRGARHRRRPAPAPL